MAYLELFNNVFEPLTLFFIHMVAEIQQPANGIRLLSKTLISG
jgi:hypothetical protein